MNEGENSGMSNNPNFSSPNISSGNEPTPIEPAVATQQVITSTDIASMANTDAGIVAAAAAAMPENDTRQAIGSIPTASQSSAAHPRFGLSNRRFNPSAAQSQPTAFAGAPDYFNQAANDIVLNDAQQNNNKKKILFIIAGVAVALVVVVCLVIFGGVQSSSPKNSVEIAESIFNSKDVNSVAKMETVYSHVISGESRSNDVLTLDSQNTLKNGAEAYRRILDELSKNKNSVKSIIKDVDVESIVNKMKENVDLYEKSSASLSAVIDSLANNDDSYESKIDSSAKDLAKSYVDAYRNYQKNASAKKSSCKSDLAVKTPVCDAYEDNMDKYYSVMKKSALVHKILIGDNKDKIQKGLVSSDLTKIYSKLNSDKQQKDKESK